MTTPANRALGFWTAAKAADGTRPALERLITAILDEGPPMSEHEVETLISIADDPIAFPVRDALIDRIVRSPTWPVWHLLEIPTNPAVVELRLRLMAQGYRPIESG